MMCLLSAISWMRFKGGHPEKISIQLSRLQQQIQMMIHDPQDQTG